jgi:hypothetical protein
LEGQEMIDTTEVVGTAVEVLVWIMLWLPPAQFPVYISVWSTQESCQKKVQILNKHFEKQGSDPVLICVRETLRDSVTKDNSMGDYSEKNIPNREHNK